MKLSLLVLTFCLATSYMLNAQDITVSGKITDPNGAVLPGVNILLKGSNVGTTSNVNGDYSLTVSADAILQYSYIGFTLKEVSVNNRTIIDVVLVESTELLSELIVLGSRGQGRTKLETPVPVDVIKIADLSANMPQMDIAQMLVNTAPSFSAIRSQGGDLSSHVDPPTLRGLAPNQMLVLINGKRRHTSALLAGTQTGSSANAVDMSLIPAAAIDRVEILRDGAAAQYGSDAIAGVMNIILKKGSGEFTGSLTVGGYPNIAPDFGDSDLTQDELALTRETDPDGFNYQFTGNYGLEFSNGGYLSLTGMLRQDKRTIRPTVLSTDRAPLYSDIYLNNEITDVNGNPIITNPELVTAMAAGNTALADELRTVTGLMNARNIDQLDVATYAGQPALNLGGVTFNFGMPVSENVEFYAFGDVGFKYTEGYSCFYRRAAQSDRTNFDLYPNGYRPQIYSNQSNVGFTAGIAGKLGKYKFDFSNAFGRNAMRFGMFNTFNASLGSSSPVDMDLGRHSYFQNTANIDVSRYFKDVLGGLNIAFGTEFRIENYAIEAGQPESYAAGDAGILTATSDNQVLVGPDGFPLEDRNANPIVDSDGNPIILPHAGVSRHIVKNLALNNQCFRGFGPENESNTFRNVSAAYADVELDLTHSWFISAALRAENYSDFGSVLTGKVASRYLIGENFAIRGSMSSGFRAPSLQELNYSHTFTFFVGLEPFDGTLHPNNSTAARTIGIGQLQEERSRNISIGFTTKLFSKLDLTVDAFKIDIKDRVFQTSEFNASEAPVLEPVIGAGLASFRINGGDISTRGVELVANYKTKLGIADLGLTLSGTFRENQFEKANVPNLNTNLTEEELKDKYVDRASIGQFETGTPSTKLIAAATYSIGKFSTMLRGIYYGEVIDLDSRTRTLLSGEVGYADQTFPSQTTFDVGVTYHLNDHLSLSVGGNNIFNKYPDIRRYERRTFYLYSNYQQGSSGAYYFGRLTFNL